jgi:hypothetical protein
MTEHEEMLGEENFEIERVEERGRQEVTEEIDIYEFAERGEAVPAAPGYRVRIDGDVVRLESPCPTGEMLLATVGKRPCAFELVEEFVHQDNSVVEPKESVNLRKPGLKGFITAHKEIVTVFINGDPVEIERGKRTVAEILSKVQPVRQSPEGYDLLEEKDGPPLPVPENVPVTICGCEIFYSQVKTGASS